jgi:hypothetical protein
MIKIERVETFGWETAVRGMRNPLNSWEKSDSLSYEDDEGATIDYLYNVGRKDKELMTSLVKAGTDHSKFMRMLGIAMDVVAPLYWWKEFDTYKVGTVANSCSTMHKIQAKEFTLDDFSHEHLIDEYWEDGFWESEWLDDLRTTIARLNRARNRFLKTKDKKYWWQMIQLLPSSYNQRRTVMLNYEVLRNQYHARKNHKLDEWHDYCKMLEALPHSDLITMEAQKE